MVMVDVKRAGRTGMLTDIGLAGFFKDSAAEKLPVTRSS